MSKFRVHVKLTGLEIEVEGDREHATEIADNISRQFGKVIQPVALIEAPTNNAPTVEAEAPSNGASSRSARRKRQMGRASSATGGSDGTGVDWKHDVDKWGTPRQEWKSPQKMAWLLYVVEQANGKRTELIPAHIATAFNNRFKSAGPIIRQNVGRDLGNNPELFGEMEGRWFLKDKGRQEGEKLVAEARGQAAAATI